MQNHMSKATSGYNKILSQEKKKFNSYKIPSYLEQGSIFPFPPVFY